MDYNTFLCKQIFCCKKILLIKSFFLKACNRSSLVYDGRLVIDNTFHTNDSCIRSGGTLTKFKRSYYVDEWNHSCFNSKEVGQDMANKLLNILDPTVAYSNSEESMDDEDPEIKAMKPALIPLYKSPKKVYGVLPGGYYYLHICKPGLPISYDEEKMDENYVSRNNNNRIFSE